MAFCERCQAEVADAEVVTSDGVASCPRCRGALAPGAPEEEGAPPAPWHFKVLVVGTVIYLIYRLVWFILWLQHRA